MRWPALTTYLTAPQLDAATAAALLRRLFATAFLLQTALALTLAGVAALLRAPASSAIGPTAPVLAWVLVALSVAEAPLALALAGAAARRGGRGGPLGGALLAGVVLSTPAWFAALALASGQGARPAIALVAVVAVFYALGSWRCGALARTAAASGPLAARDRPTRG